AFARAAAPGQIKTAEGLLETIPDDRDLLLVVAQGYTEYTFGFIEDELESLPRGEPGANAPARVALTGRATALYDRALDFALRYLATFDGGFREVFRRGGPPLEQALSRLAKDSTPGVTLA